MANFGLRYSANVTQNANVRLMKPQLVPGIVPEFELKDRLRKAREITGMTQDEFAERAGISRATVGNAESGRKVPHKATIRLWSQETGVSLHWLLNGSTPPPNDDEGVEYRAPSRNRTDDLFFTREMLYP